MPKTQVRADPLTGVPAFSFTGTTVVRTMSQDRPADRIIFASCSSQHYEQTIWPSVLSRNASAFVWTGDAIYADSFQPKRRFWEKRKPLPATPAVMDELYLRQIQVEGYKQLLEETDAVILGAQDDHGTYDAACGRIRVICHEATLTPSHCDSL